MFLATRAHLPRYQKRESKTPTYKQTYGGSNGGLYRDMSSDSEHLNDFELHYFPAATWAVFVAKGSSRVDAKQKTFDQITKEWFPQTNYRLDNTYSVMISYQTPVNQDNDNDLGIFWVPIVEA